METSLGPGTVRPTLPVALPLRPPVHQANPRAVTWWRLRALVAALGFTGPQLVALAVLGSQAPWWLAGTATATAVLSVAYLAVVPAIRYRIHRWEVTEHAVYVLSGWLVREWRIAPISRVQTVDTERGPLQQLIRLATVTVTTASAKGAVKISGLDARDAAELARDLTETTQATPGDAT